MSAYELGDDIWTISYADVVLLRHRLDTMDLIEGRTISEEAYTFITSVYNHYARNEEIKRGVNNSYIRSMLEGKLKTLPYEDQYTGIAYAVNNRRAGIFDEMGIGKTLQALATIVALGDQVKRTLVICPYTVQIGFTREIKKHTSLKPISVPSGRERALEFVKANRNTNWDLMLVHPENLVTSGKTRWEGDVFKVLRTYRWDMVIVDEAHMYKNMEAKRSKCVFSLMNDTLDRNGNMPRVLMMTGTPVSESPMNAYVILKALSVDSVAHITRFENHFVVTAKVEVGKKRRDGERKEVDKEIGYRNLDELKVLLESVSIRRTKSDMVGFPDKVITIRDVVMHGKQLELYKRICNEISKKLQDTQEFDKFMEDQTRGLRLRQVLSHPKLLGEDGTSAKFEECDAILEEVLQDPVAKVVIWAEFRDTIDLLYERYSKPYGAVKIYGGVDNEDLSEIEKNFENDMTTRVAICIPKKAGTGVDFLARARTSIYIDRPYSYTLYKQSMDRIHRRVATQNPTWLDAIRSQPATLIFLDVVDSMDELIREKLKVKEDMAEALTTSNIKLLEMGRDDLLHYLMK
jgi:SNF2 family DNA or RNA helicase